MRSKVLQILWHNKDPVYSLDFHPNGMLATAGQDKEVMLWVVGRDADGGPTVHPCATLTSGHATAVNCVRFSPTGEHVVSAGDAGEMVLWKVDMSRLDGDATHWSRTILRAHTNDVQHISWAPDGSALVTAGIDNESVLWDSSTGKAIVRLDGHRHYVQGAAWDPAGRYIATLSSDRTCRIYGLKPPVVGKKRSALGGAKPSAATLAKGFVCQHVLAKGPATTLPGNTSETVGKAPLFEDESCNTFFRRLAWSPDGSFLAVPTGLTHLGEGDSRSSVAATHIFARGCWDAPVLSLPAPAASSTLAVAFCPLLFALRTPVPGDITTIAGTLGSKDDVAAADGDSSGRPVQLPYRMVFAVATSSSILLYDTQGMQAVAVIGAAHPALITDLAWSCDGTTLAVSSQDGYCSMTAFGPDELGAPATADAVPTYIARRLLSATKALQPRQQSPMKQPLTAKPTSAARTTKGTADPEDMAHTLTSKSPAPHLQSLESTGRPRGAAPVPESQRSSTMLPPVSSLVLTPPGAPSHASVPALAGTAAASCTIGGPPQLLSTTALQPSLCVLPSASVVSLPAVSPAVGAKRRIAPQRVDSAAAPEAMTRPEQAAAAAALTHSACHASASKRRIAPQCVPPLATAADESLSATKVSQLPGVSGERLHTQTYGFVTNTCAAAKARPAVSYAQDEQPVSSTVHNFDPVASPKSAGFTTADDVSSPRSMRRVPFLTTCTSSGLVPNSSKSAPTNHATVSEPPREHSSDARKMSPCKLSPCKTSVSEAAASHEGQPALKRRRLTPVPVRSSPAPSFTSPSVADAPPASPQICTMDTRDRSSDGQSREAHAKPNRRIQPTAIRH